MRWCLLLPWHRQLGQLHNAVPHRGSRRHRGSEFSLYFLGSVEKFEDLHLGNRENMNL